MPDIFLLESEGNYTRVCFGNERPLIRRSPNALESQLDPAMFFRAGRKQIVNLKWIEKVDAGIGGGLVATLRGGRTVEMSRRRSARLREILSLWAVWPRFPQWPSPCYISKHHVWRALMAKGFVAITVERCKGCGFCVEFCPTHVLALSSAFNSTGYHPPHVVDADKCSGCDLCGMYCPDFAIFGGRYAR